MIAKSWVPVAADSHFPLQNLPFGTCDTQDSDGAAVVRIGDFVVDLFTLAEAGLIDVPEDVLTVTLEEILEVGGREAVRQIRRDLYELLVEENPTLRDDAELRGRALIPTNKVEMRLPLGIPAFVDFYSGINHASNVGRMFRPDMPPLLPNYRHLPVGYNGRASSVIVSGDPVIRPNGQTKGANDEMPTFGPSKELDFELEMGFFVAEGNAMGEPISVNDAPSHMLGMVLVNDWSARDVQRWEYQPLGPFLAKSFATSISPWIVLLDALEPFRTAGPPQDPEVLPYLRQAQPFHFDVHLEVAIKTPKMASEQVICRTNAKELYWSMAQQLAHQTCNGTPVEMGDLYASGTISGSEPGTFGSLLELTWRGQQPITLESGETRTFLEDGDILTMRGWCQGEGYRVGFGEVSAQIRPAQ